MGERRRDAHTGAAPRSAQTKQNSLIVDEINSGGLLPPMLRQCIYQDDNILQQARARESVGQARVGVDGGSAGGYQVHLIRWRAEESLQGEARCGGRRTFLFLGFDSRTMVAWLE